MREEVFDVVVVGGGGMPEPPHKKPHMHNVLPNSRVGTPTTVVQ